MTTTIKKYSNRRLYDTSESRYITLEELATKVRGGTDVRVVDAASDEDLTQATLAQIIFESRGASRLLPVSLLTQLIRMGDDSLAEFLGRYLSVALEWYVGARQSAQSVSSFNPLATLPFQMTSGLARFLSGIPVWPDAGAPATAPPHAAPPPEPTTPSPPPAAPAAASAPSPSSEISDLRRELEALKDVIKGALPRKKKPRK
jgi:polyhydroxyalkanoate synthesis repressor PhaR